MKTNAGQDCEADAFGGSFVTGTNATGVATTAPTATTITLDGVSAPGSTSFYTGHIVTCGGGYGVVLANTNAAPPVLTIDKWYDPANPSGAALATPAAGRWIIVPGNAPALWMALNASTAAPAATDTTLATGGGAEINAAGGGLNRKLATYGHTAGVNSWTASTTFTANGSDSLPVTPGKMGLFNAANGGRMAFETLIPSPGALASVGDQLTLTDTITE